MPIIPDPLKRGDKIGIVAPAGNLNHTHNFTESCHIIQDMGFKLVFDRTVWPGSGYLADSDHARLEEFHRIWTNPEIKAVFALRGGFGSLRIISQIDFSLPRKNPKLFLGFSDITILLNHLYQRANLACVHGPVFGSLPLCDRKTIDELYNTLTGSFEHTEIEPLTVFRNGPSVSGKLIGGNLCSMVTMLGTGYFPDLADHILFLEDINEPPYRLDRMLTQLALAGAFNDVRAVLVGDFTFGKTSDGETETDLSGFVCSRLCELISDRTIPIWKNLPVGHSQRNIPVYIGRTVEMVGGENGRLIFKES